MKNILCIIIFSLAVLLTGCSRNILTLPVHENAEALVRFNTPAQYDYNPAHYPVTIENYNTQGEPEQMTYTKPPERVVAVWQNSIETLLALGVGDRIIAGNGVPDKKFFRKEYQEQYSKIPYTGLQLLDLETTMMLKPDLIVGWHSTFAPKVLRPTDFWHKRGVNTFIARSSMITNKERTLKNEYKDILDLGKIFDKNERAQQLVGQMQQEVNFAISRTADYPRRPRALVLEFMGKEPTVYGEKSLAGNIVKELHGELLAEKQRAIGLEQVVELDPDVIFVVVIESHYGHEQDMLDRVIKHKALKHLRCVQQGRVVALPLYAIYSSGVRTYDGIKIIATGMYPDLYKEK
ncbi:ABC transporter substrate-binding protein [uncultured Phascolarctobacterium sp.]|uniref:ABC transporter substrate-binding protein n=1 Tax=uncultured Phascolarctobacterium sp. TaxID=512296 RepID=UPI0025DB2BD9|nr:ABC transporter substrate-binding protein [uncultured Phascolarctobacterium sp.]